MRKLSLASMLASLTLLSACESVPRVASCPPTPRLPVREPLGPTYQDRMQDFLSGKLPEPTASAPR